MQHNAAALAAALALALCLLAGSVRGGCYRNGRTRPQLAEEELSHNYVPAPQLAKEKLPRSFNWCDLDGKNWCAPSWNQHIPAYCGSCWLHGTLSAIQDRIKIQKNGRGEDVMLGRQSLLNCAPFHNYSAGCDGGDPIDVFRYMHKFGLPDEGCYPYQATDFTKFEGVKECPADAFCRNCMPLNGTDVCWAVETPIIYKLQSYGKLSPGTEEGMMSEIYARGPITCSMATPDAFVYGYHGGVWHGANDTDVDHDVEVVGWGEDDGEPVWHIRNSWGTFWGELGFFRLPRGVNSLMIEGDDCWVATPDWSMEEDVLDGKLEGSMYGLQERVEESAVA